MSAEMIAVVAVGLLAGWAAGFFVKGGGLGVMSDLALGLGGSIVAAVVVQMLGMASEPGSFAMSIVALIGATVVIGAQRRFYRHA
ncbi:MAG TPA: GlsB/YeaQ/YmgE family stress response membrane protein [Methylomirabilota bacterium]|jgi:uncharacterized membrane protein YeaQ/YmgE (transglycosylase-associated protein family)|nr:GlsB/YeaQ/YmgE family stress response membrane protein [Methylomirabilota bacterium]